MKFKEKTLNDSSSETDIGKTRLQFNLYCWRMMRVQESKHTTKRINFQNDREVILNLHVNNELRFVYFFLQFLDILLTKKVNDGRK